VVTSADLKGADRDGVGTTRSRELEGRTTDQAARRALLVRVLEPLCQVHPVAVECLRLALRATGGTGGDRPRSDTDARAKAMALEVAYRIVPRQLIADRASPCTDR